MKLNYETSLFIFKDKDSGIFYGVRFLNMVETVDGKFETVKYERDFRGIGTDYVEAGSHSKTRAESLLKEFLNKNNFSNGS